MELIYELYRHCLWVDEHTVAILATAVTSLHVTVMSKAMKFFLNIKDVMNEDEEQ